MRHSRPNPTRTFLLSILLGILLVPALAAQEMLPAMDVPIASDLRQPSVFTRTDAKVSPAALVGNLRSSAGGVLAGLSPAAKVQQARRNWQEGRFYAMDYSEHGTPRAALARSLQPWDLRTNVRASVRAGFHPAALVGTVFTPLGIELQRQLAGGEGFNPSKLLRSFEPGAIAGGLVAGVGADVMGAAVQSTLAGTMGPIGPVAGLLARPIIGYTAYLIGSNFGRSVQNGKPSLRTATAESLRTINPVRDMGAIVGGTVGAVVGQALIPIPIVGGIIGGTVGGLLGTSLGNLLGNKGPLAGFNHNAMDWMNERADAMTSADDRSDRDAGTETPTGASELADESTGPVAQDDTQGLPGSRFDATYLAWRPLEAVSPDYRGGEVTPDEALFELNQR